MSGRPFLKMHGLGNDFVVIDAREAPCALSEPQAQRIADRRLGVGCDQLIVIEPPPNGAADVFMRIRNPDGREAEACGNATRCVASVLMAEAGAERLTIQTLAGLLEAERAAGGLVTVDMGPAYLEWDEIPLREACDTLALDLSLGPLSRPVAVGMGNPHAVFFVDDAAAVDLARLGPQLETDSWFPERANISVAQITGPDRIRQTVLLRNTIGLQCRPKPAVPVHRFSLNAQVRVRRIHQRFRHLCEQPVFRLLRCLSNVLRLEIGVLYGLLHIVSYIHHLSMMPIQ